MLSEVCDRILSRTLCDCVGTGNFQPISKLPRKDSGESRSPACAGRGVAYSSSQ